MMRSTALALSLSLVAHAPQAIAGNPPPQGMQYANEHWRQSLELYIPDHGCTPFPLIIFMHGGGWYSGDSTFVQPFLTAMIDRGFAVAAVNYRWSFQAIFPAQIHDCKAAVRFLRGNASVFNLDPNRFIAFGDSAGGHLAALLGTANDIPALEGTVGDYDNQSSRVQFVIDFYGPTDMFELGVIHNSPDSMVSQLFGWPIQDIIDHQNDPGYAEIVALVHSANPANHATNDDPPFHIVHGQADTFVPPSQSQLLHDALTTAGAASTLVLVPGYGHTMPVSFYEQAFDAMMQAANITQADLNCDGTVNVIDLLAVINAWGQCSSKACPSDIAPVGGDGVVNVNDLLKVINNWG